MKLSPFASALVAVALGAAAGSAVTAKVWSIREQQRLAVHDAAIREAFYNDFQVPAANRAAAGNVDLFTLLQGAGSLFVLNEQQSSQLVACQDALDHERQNAHAGDSFVTLVYTPDQAAGQSALQLANAIKPGLGAILSQMAPPPQLKLRFVLRGEVVPLVNASDGSRFVITRVSGSAQ